MAKRILLVDDNVAVRKAMRTVLVAEPDWEVCGEAIHGLDAIEKAQQLRPDLIILDLCMPIMDGLQAARILKEKMPEVPLILFTAHKHELFGSAAFDAGFSAVFSKDDLGALVTQVRSLLHP